MDSNFESTLLSILSAHTSEQLSISKKKLRKQLKKETGDISKHDFQRCLKALLGTGKVETSLNAKGKEAYWLSSRPPENDTRAKRTTNVSDQSEGAPGLTFAEMMRRKKLETGGDNTNSNDVDSGKVEQSNVPESSDQNIDLDEEIKRLEAELQSDNDEDSDDEIDDASSSDSNISLEAETSRNNSGVICLSEFSADRIAPLPQTVLPSNKRKKLKEIDDDGIQPREQKKKKRKGNDQPSSKIEGSGLQDAVKELLHGYVARSSQKIPFYCRICAVQSGNLEEFVLHKETELHIAAARAERKACYCRLCQKQFTSPAQMKEHLASKPHRQKMDYVKAKQRNSNTFSKTKNSHSGDEKSKRQWC